MRCLSRGLWLGDLLPRFALGFALWWLRLLLLLLGLGAGLLLGLLSRLLLGLLSRLLLGFAALSLFLLAALAPSSSARRRASSSRHLAAAPSIVAPRAPMTSSHDRIASSLPGIT